MRDEIQTLKERNNETPPALAPPPSGPALPPSPEEEKSGGCLRAATYGCLVLSVGFFLGFAALAFVLTKLGWSVGDLVPQPPTTITEEQEPSDGEASGLPNWATSEAAWSTVPKPKRGDG